MLSATCCCRTRFGGEVESTTRKRSAGGGLTTASPSIRINSIVTRCLSLQHGAETLPLQTGSRSCGTFLRGEWWVITGMPPRS
jgi:hypothetical protein